MKPKTTTRKTTKKAVTLLTKIETLMSDVIDECSDIEKTVEKKVQAVLLSARSGIVSAIQVISAALPSEVQTKPVKKAKPSVIARKRTAAPVARKKAVAA